jgi:membrane-associated phospholipid phosphatase
MADEGRASSGTVVAGSHVPATLVPAAVRQRRRRRRPSGAPPALPRSLGATGKGWLVVLVVLFVGVVVALNSRGVERVAERADSGVLRAVAHLRVGWLTTVVKGVDRVAAGWTVSGVAYLLLLALVVLRRWRHLFTFVVAVVGIKLVGQALYNGFSRPRPFDVSIVGSWRGYSMPAVQVAVLTIVVVTVVYTLVVPGRARSVAKVVVVVVVGLYAAARLYLGVDHPSDVVVGVVLCVAVLVNAFRFFTPNEVFPVAYRRGKTAHLDVGGRRGEALRRAVEDQLGVTIVDVKPVGLAGSGGSTPLRIRLAGDPDTYVFGKLYAMNHVRADRWYKLGRTILYGRLEDEAPFQSVRRLVQYEDYAARVLRDAGVRTAAPHGIVELTPEREYLLITEFLYGAKEIGDPEVVVDEQLIDEGLGVVRQLWDAGVAHRDIKPANLMVRDGHLILIDVAFAQVRPSPWRQAVDLANMMLVLAVRTDAETVYQRALRCFTPDEIGEAFAAARGIASPTQLRVVMKHDGRDLLAQFRAMAPQRRPISLQRWSIRRVLLALALLLGAFLSYAVFSDLFNPSEIEIGHSPTCGTNDLLITMAQTVPSATQIPCIASLPAGWEPDVVQVRTGHALFYLDSDRAGHRAVEVRLRPLDECDVSDAVEVPSDEVGMRRFERPERLPPNLAGTRLYLFDGGCVTYRFSFGGDTNASLTFEADSALAFQPRQTLVDDVAHRFDLRLCGAGAPPCQGGS